VKNLVLISQGVFSRRTLEKRPFLLRTYIVYATLPCANALACDLLVVELIVHGAHHNIVNVIRTRKCASCEHSAP
jgi:hypothetical protein